jgi:hypothetical protein
MLFLEIDSIFCLDLPIVFKLKRLEVILHCIIMTSSLLLCMYVFPFPQTCPVPSTVVLAAVRHRSPQVRCLRTRSPRPSPPSQQGPGPPSLRGQRSHWSTRLEEH